MNAIDAHPPPERITAYAHGKLSDEESARIEEHVEGCPACSRLLQQQPDDSLTLLARSLPPWEGETDRPTVSAESVPTDPPLGPPVEPPPLPPELANHPRYRVLGVLGQGGMGTVYLAEHLKMNRRVALKVIRPDLLDRPDALKRFEQEVHAAARLQHPNIVQAFDADEAGGLHFLVMEYVEGTDLARLVETEGRLPVPMACEIVRQAALGLQHAHEQGMVHRDIKPHNLMLERPGGKRPAWPPLGEPPDCRTGTLARLDGQECPSYKKQPTGAALVAPDWHVKILDFGLAGFARGQQGDATARLTGSGVVMGTADYIAPEQTRNANLLDIRADIYALGCTLYQLLAGRVPYPGGTVVDKMLRHSLDAPPPLGLLRPELPHALVAVVEKMMAKDASARFQSPADVARALVPFLQPTAPSRRWGAPLSLGIGLTVLVLGAVLLGLQTGENPAGIVRPGVGPTLTTPVAVLPAKVGAILTLPRTSRVTDIWPKLSPDGRLVGLVWEERQGVGADTLRLHETATGRKVRDLGFPGRRLTDAEFTPDGKQVLTAFQAEDRTFEFHLWDVQTGEPRRLASIGKVSGWISQFRFSADGARFSAMGEEDRDRYNRRVYDIPTGKTLALVRPPREKGSYYLGTALTPDGNLAVSTRDGESADSAEGYKSELIVTHLDGSGQRIYPLGHRANGFPVVIDAVSGEVAVAAGDGGKRLWVQYYDPKTGRPTRMIPLSEKGVTTFTISPGARRVAVVDLKGEEGTHRIRVLDRSGKEVFRTLVAEVQWALLSADGRVLAVVTDDEVTLFRLPDADAVASTTVEHLHTIVSPTGKDLWEPGFSSDNRYVMAAINPYGGQWPRLLVWDAARGQLLREINSPTGGWFTGYALLPGRRAIGAFGKVPNDGTFEFRTWEIATGKMDRLAELDTTTMWAAGFAVSPDGKHFAFVHLNTGDVVEGIHICDSATGKEVASVEPVEKKRMIRAKQFSADSRFLVTLDSLPEVEGQPQYLFRWTAVTTGRVERRITVGGWIGVEDFGLTNDGKKLVVSRHDKAIGYAAEFFDIETGKSLRTQPFGPAEGLDSVFITADGRFGILHNGDRSVRLYDLTDGREVAIPEAVADPGIKVRVSPDGTRLSLGGLDGFRLFRVPSGR